MSKSQHGIMYSFKEHNPYYIYEVIFYDEYSMIYHCDEYEFDGIQLDSNRRAYKYRRRLLMTREMFKHTVRFPSTLYEIK